MTLHARTIIQDVIRAGNGHIVWSETCDRPWGDEFVGGQDNIAGELTTGLRASVEASPDH